jgi:hypothetical protein
MIWGSRIAAEAAVANADINTAQKNERLNNCEFDLILIFQGLKV